MGATIAAATGETIVAFDRALKPGVRDPLNWTVKANIALGARIHTLVGNPIATGFTVTMQTTPAGIAFPPLGLSYNAAPPDVVDMRGVAVVAFIDLPLVVI